MPPVYWKISLSGNDLETDPHIVFLATETRMVLWFVSVSYVSQNMSTNEEKENIWHVQKQDFHPECFNSVPSFSHTSRRGYDIHTV